MIGVKAKGYSLFRVQKTILRKIGLTKKKKKEDCREPVS